jgi:DNA-binding NarL/FixJ family response regulator
VATLTKARRPEVKTRVLVVDDHPLVRRGLRELISGEGDMEVCGEAADAVDALAMAKKIRSDVAIVDISLPRGYGLDLVKQLRSNHDEIKVLVVSMHDESLFAERALRAGALGYINKQQATENVVDAIRRILSGRVYLSPHMTDQILDRTLKPGDHPKEKGLEGLSTRELAVFEMIGHGMTTREVAHKLHISTKTVETYREHIKDKLKLKNSNELVCHATQWVLENK